MEADIWSWALPIPGRTQQLLAKLWGCKARLRQGWKDVEAYPFSLIF